MITSLTTQNVYNSQCLWTFEKYSLLMTYVYRELSSVTLDIHKKQTHKSRIVYKHTEYKSIKFMLIFLTFPTLWDRILCSGFFWTWALPASAVNAKIWFFFQLSKLNLFQFLFYHLENFLQVFSQSHSVLSSFTSLLKQDPCTCWSLRALLYALC